MPVEAEDAGFEVRDCLLVVGARTQRVWLLRKPLKEPTVAAQILATGTGALWIDGCRVSYQSEADRANAFPGGTLTSREAKKGGLGCGYVDGKRIGFSAVFGGALAVQSRACTWGGVQEIGH